MEILEQTLRYTVSCVYCGRTVFRAARRLGDVQLTMIESHLLICRPLASSDRTTNLLEHCRVTETPG